MTNRIFIFSRSPIYWLVVLLVFTAAEIQPGNSCLANTANNQNMANIQNNDTKSSKAKPVKKTPSRLLIPPPPPIIPLGGTSGAGMPIEFMSQAELKKQKDSLVQLIDRVSKSEDDYKMRLKEAKEKAVQFESLYKEGVVSKREWEQAKSDIPVMEDQLDSTTDKLHDLQSQLAQVTAQLKHLQPMKSQGTNAGAGYKHRSGTIVNP